MRPAAPATTAAVALAAAALAGCGDDSKGSRGNVAVDSGGTVEVKADEYSFEPGTVTVRGARGRARVRFRLRNEGTLPHDVHVRRDGDDLGGTEAVGDGESAEATVELPPGEYETFCSIGDHAQLGMRGKLKVE
ncbi:MAG TPA: cupredoxin domain-containing protein [Thermoleophilaceae bacterium]|jgi:plastocyanin